MVSVEVPDPTTVASEKVTVAPVGNPLALKFTLPVNPFNDPTETDVVAEPPAVTVCEPGLTETEKSGAGATGPTAKLQTVCEPNSEYKTQ